MFAYPGNPNSHIYEERRAPKVLQQSVGYYAVIDLHNNDDFGENTAAIDIDCGVSPVVLGFLGDLGIRNLIATKHFGLHAHVTNALALETLTSDLGSDMQALRDAFDNLSNSPNLSTANAGDFNWFTYVSYGLHVDAISPEDLSEQEFASIRAFQPVPDMFAQRLGVQDEQICPMGWSAQPNEYGYWAELVTPASTPDDTHWKAA